MKIERDDVALFFASIFSIYTVDHIAVIDPYWVVFTLLFNVLAGVFMGWRLAKPYYQKTPRVTKP